MGRRHVWVQAPFNWGCTFEVDRGVQCMAEAIIACMGRRGDCDGQEGRCRERVRGDEFPKPYNKGRRTGVGEAGGEVKT